MKQLNLKKNCPHLRSFVKHNSYLGKCGYSVLTRKQWWIFSNLEIEVHSFVCESRELIAEAELVCSIPGCSKCEAIILFLHLFVQHNAIGIFQPTVNIIMTPSDHLETKTKKLSFLKYGHLYISSKKSGLADGTAKLFALTGVLRYNEFI